MVIGLTSVPSRFRPPGNALDVALVFGGSVHVRV